MTTVDNPHRGLYEAPMPGHGLAVAAPERPDVRQDGTPTPAGSAASEDGGQRYENDTSASELSDKYPAGLHPDTEFPRRHSRTSDGTVAARRHVHVDVRVTAAERDAIRARARVLGVKPSTWARVVMLDALDVRRDHVQRLHTGAASAPDADVASAVQQLRRVGINLNQALRRDLCVEDALVRDVAHSVSALRAQLGDRTAS